MLKLIVPIVFFITVGLCVPPKVRDDGPNCGLRQLRKREKSPFPNGKATDWRCELCLDLVSVVEMYLDCDEAYADEKFDEECDKLGALKGFCRQIVDGIYEDLRADTDQDPGAVCTKQVKPESGQCTWS